MVILSNSTLFVNYFAFYARISSFLCISFVFPPLQMVFAANKESVQAGVPIR